jgi:hypothetical protein
MEIDPRNKPRAPTPRAPSNDVVQIGPQALDSWGALTRSDPTISALLMWMLRSMNRTGTVGFSQRSAAAAMGVSTKTIQRAIKRLAAQNFVQQVRVNGQSSMFHVNALFARRVTPPETGRALFDAPIIPPPAVRFYGPRAPILTAR